MESQISDGDGLAKNMRVTRNRSAEIIAKQAYWSYSDSCPRGAR